MALTRSIRQPDFSPCKICFWVGLFVSALVIGLAVFLTYQMMAALAGPSFVSPFEIVFSDAVQHTVRFTLFQATLSTFLALIVGFGFAWALLGVGRFYGKSWLLAISASVFVLPSLVVVLGVVTVYGRAGWLNSIVELLGNDGRPFSPYGLSGILIAHIFFNAGIAARAFHSALSSIPGAVRKQSLALGLSLFAHFRIVLLPAIIPVATSLGATIFLICFTSFAIVLTLGGSPAFNTLEVAIYEAVKFDFDLPKALALAMIQILVCGILVFLVNATFINNQARAVSHSGDTIGTWSPAWLKGIKWILVISISLFFVLPILAVIADGLNAHFFSVLSKPSFQAAFLNSISIALTSALLCLFLSWMTASATVALMSKTRLKGYPFHRLLGLILQFSSQLYLVIPALVFGLGLFMAYLNFGGKLSTWTFWGVVAANTLFAMPFTVAILKPALARVAKSNDRLAASLGVGPLRRLVSIDWPLLRSDVSLVLALAFCFSLGDLGVIALFADDEFRTLPWLLYQHFGAYRTGEAAAIALVMMLMNLGIFFGATKIGGNVNYDA